MKFKVCVTCLASLGLILLASAACLAQKPELVVETGHSALISSVAFSLDGKTLASGSWDYTIKLWDVGTGRELRTLSGHDDLVNSVAFSADGKTLASGSIDKMVKLWEVATGRELRTLSGHSSSVESVAFSADGKTLASGSNDKMVKLWEVATGRELRTLSGHSSSVESVAFSADGKTLASVSDDKTIKLWGVATGRELRTLSGHSGSVLSVAFSADGRALASGSADKTIKLWEVATGRELCTLSGHSGPVFSTAFSPDGKTLASGSADKTIKLWEVATGRELRTLSGHSSSVESVAFSPDGKTLASGSDDITIKLWEVATGRELRTLSGHSGLVSSVAFSADGKTLASVSDDETIKLWEVATGRELRTLSGHSGSVLSVAFSADGKTLASGSADKTIKLWEVATGRELRTLSGHFSGINSVEFSTDGKTLASGSADKTIKLWKVATGRELRTLSGHSRTVLSVAFSLDGKTIASGSDDNTIKLWEAETGREVRTLNGHSSSVNSVAFNPDGKTLASGSDDKTIKLWEVASGRDLRMLRGHSGPVLSVAFNLDGKTLASGSDDTTIKLWEVGTGRELRTLSAHAGSVSSVGFSADGQFLLSGGSGTTNLWSVGTGELLVSLIALDKADWAIVAPDGRFDASPIAQKLMHWMVGSEPIKLEQLKERYYEPGLLAKLLHGQPIREVNKFENPKLYPDVKVEAPATGSGMLTITLTNHEGGIGRVQVFVNGKEFLADARDRPTIENPNLPQATLNIDLSKASNTITGKENQVRVVAWNVENYISSPGAEAVWVAGGPTKNALPEVYAIVGGVSHYASPKLTLNFAAKDAIDMANVIELGAKRLFGADKVHLTLLSTAEDPRTVGPTKDNFAKAFAAAREAKPTDIFIVYLAGHGITLQRGTDTYYCYLTQEARTTDTTALSDPAVLRQTTITSEELVEWIKEIPANKQVVMLDTCAAGAAQGQLKLVDKREVSGDAIRAIDRAKDRTGSYILMGSAADAVSYEASQYGQGLLTYALLKGMKGPALRNDEFVDVSNLFHFAREEVEGLAKNIGGIQKPITFAPNDESFDVGRLMFDDKQKIALATPKPMILRPRFLDAQASDPIDLMKTLRALLRDESYVIGRGASEGGLVFVDDEEFPGAIRPAGIYTVEGDRVTVMLHLQRDGTEIFNTRIISTKHDVAAKVLETVKAAIGRL